MIKDVDVKMYLENYMLPYLQTRNTVYRSTDESLQASHSVGCLQSGVGNEKQCQMSTRQVLVQCWSRNDTLMSRGHADPEPFAATFWTRCNVTLHITATYIFQHQFV